MVMNNATNLYGPPNWIVDPILGVGTHQTITAAMATATSGQTVFVRPGTYTENFTITPGVNLAAYPNSAVGQVTIIGKMSSTTLNASSVISGIRFQTNNDFTISHTDGNLYFVNCDFQVNQNVIALRSITSHVVNINFTNCTASINNSGGQLLYFQNPTSFFVGCTFLNPAKSTVVSLFSNGCNTFINNCYMQIPFQVNNISLLQAQNSTFDFQGPNSAGFNAQAIDFSSAPANNQPNAALNCYFNTGSSPCIQIDTSSTAIVSHCVLTSSNTNVITGSGTLKYAMLSFAGSSSATNVSTQTALATLV